MPPIPFRLVREPFLSLRNNVRKREVFLRSRAVHIRRKTLAFEIGDVHFGAGKGDFQRVLELQQPLRFGNIELILLRQILVRVNVASNIVEVRYGGATSNVV